MCDACLLSYIGLKEAHQAREGLQGKNYLSKTYNLGQYWPSSYN